MSTRTLEEAQRLVNAGISVIPIDPHTKLDFIHLSKGGTAS